MSLSTRQRIALLGPVVRRFPELGAGGTVALRQWVELELGSVDALDKWTRRGKDKDSTRARAPRSIYHLCPGNVAVAAWQSLLVGLVLGAENRVKLSSDRRQAAEVRRFAAALPAPLRKLVSFTGTFRPAELQAAEAVIATGRDETVAEIRRHLRPGQTFLAYGHRVSLLWLGKVTGRETALVRACARDLARYDQLGCLSPQAVYLAPGSDRETYCAALSEALAKEAAAPLPPEAAAAIRQARQLAAAAGARAWTGPRHTVIADPDPAFVETCGWRVVPVRIASRETLGKVLAPLRGILSTVGLRTPFARADEALFWDLGAERLCPAGQCQEPPLWRHHDGRPRLSDLVKWVDREE
jgi:hypothetical protein